MRVDAQRSTNMSFMVRNQPLMGQFNFGCSGQFKKGMKVQLARNGKTIALTRPQKMFAQDRTTVEVGYAGDGILFQLLRPASVKYTGRYSIE